VKVKIRWGRQEKAKMVSKRDKLDSKTKVDQPLFKKAFNPLHAYQDS
jgi:hypothetical protein